MISRAVRFQAYALVFLLIATMLTSCADAGGRKLGTAIPADAPIVKLADIVAAPADFAGKKVVMRGIVSAQCPSLCEFTFKEGTLTTLIYPQGFKFPRLKVGKPVTLYAEITSGSGSVVVSALGLRME